MPHSTHSAILDRCGLPSQATLTPAVLAPATKHQLHLESSSFMTLMHCVHLPSGDPHPAPCPGGFHPQLLSLTELMPSSSFQSHFLFSFYSAIVSTVTTIGVCLAFCFFLCCDHLQQKLCTLDKLSGQGRSMSWKETKYFMLLGEADVLNSLIVPDHLCRVKT